MSKKADEKVTQEPELNVPGKAQPEKEEVEDRSAFNCSTCRGDGLVPQGTKDIICPSCLGTGKV